MVCSLVLKLVGRIDLSLRLLEDEMREVGLSLLVGCDADVVALLLSSAESPAAALRSELELEEDEEHTEEEPIMPCSELTELKVHN